MTDAFAELVEHKRALTARFTELANGFVERQFAAVQGSVSLAAIADVLPADSERREGDLFVRRIEGARPRLAVADTPSGEGVVIVRLRRNADREWVRTYLQTQRAAVDASSGPFWLADTLVLDDLVVPRPTPDESARILPAVTWGLERAEALRALQQASIDELTCWRDAVSAFGPSERTEA